MHENPRSPGTSIYPAPNMHPEDTNPKLLIFLHMNRWFSRYWLFMQRSTDQNRPAMPALWGFNHDDKWQLLWRWWWLSKQEKNCRYRRCCFDRQKGSSLTLSSDYTIRASEFEPQNFRSGFQGFFRERKWRERETHTHTRKILIGIFVIVIS